MVFLRPAILVAAAATVLVACNPPKPRPDAGYTADDSCGIDCPPQKHFGLTVGACYEYSKVDSSKADPPSLGVEVKAVSKIGELKVLPVEYREGGQLRMTDNFTFRDGALLLVRREFPAGDSVTYTDGDGGLSGVTWASVGQLVDDTQSSSSQADVIPASGTRRYEATTYAVSMSDATAQDLKTPLQSFDAGYLFLFQEAPDHGADRRRTLVPETGFVVFSSSFLPLGGTATKYHLQNIRDMKADGGSALPCGIGN